MVRRTQWEAVVGEGGELFAAHQLGVFVRPVVEGTADIPFTEKALRQLWPLARGYTYASNRQASIGHSGVDASRSVLSVARPPGLSGGNVCISRRINLFSLLSVT